jgi:hypothetical protein
MRHAVGTYLGLSAALLFAACSADRPLNPSFPLTVDAAELALGAMNAHPKPPERPIVVLSGLFDPGFGCKRLAERLTTVTTDDAPIISVCFTRALTFDLCAQRVIAAVEQAYPSHDPVETVEVDVVACSMGGLVARYAALDRRDELAETQGRNKRLNVRRLFTISTPHRGAKLAKGPALDQRIAWMRSGSSFLAALEAKPPRYELYPYVRLGDKVIGEENAAPPNRAAWWVKSVPFSEPHTDADRDPRILADIGRRLRGEAPFTLNPAQDLPDQNPFRRALD